MCLRIANVHYITEAAETALNLALYFAANIDASNSITQLAHDVMRQSVNLISNDPERSYIDPTKSIIIEWVHDRRK